MANRKIYIDKKFSAKEISQGKNFAKLLTQYKKISIPFYAKTSFILSAIVTTIAITGSLIYITYFAKNDINAKEHTAIVNQLAGKTIITAEKNETFLKNSDMKNNIEVSSSSNLSHRDTTASTAEMLEKKHGENTSELTTGTVNNQKVGHSMPVGSNKSQQETNATIGSSIKAIQEKKSLERSKNQSTIVSKPNVKNKKSSATNSNITTETSDYNQEKQNTQTKSTRLNKNKNNLPSDNSNFKNNKQHQNVFASQEKTTPVANNSKNPNVESESTKNKTVAIKDKVAVPNNADTNPSDKSNLKEKEIKTGSDIPSITNNSIKNLPDSSSSVNPINNPVLSKDSIKNADTIQNEKTNKGDFERSFDKRKIVVSVGISLGVYGTLSTDVNGATKKDGAASIIYSLSSEYGVTKWIGLGAKFSFDNYFVKPDSTTGIIPHAYSLNGSGFINFHFVRTKRFDLLGGVSAGYSRFAIKSHDINNTAVMGNGSLFGLYVVPRFYFGKRFGMFVNISFAGFKYSSLEIKNNLMQVSSNHSFIGNGFNIGIGAQMKF